MYCFNTTLWLELPRLTGMTRMGFYKEIGTTCKPYYYVARSGDIRLTTLIEICNKFRISARSFIIDGEPHIPDNLIISRSEWTDIDLHIGQLEECYKQNVGGCTYDKFFETVDYRPQSYGIYVRNAEETTIKLKNLLNVCNMFGFSPWNVIIDRNGEITMKELQPIIAAMEKRIAELEKEVKRLKKSR